jgi:hypothetical protein
MVRKAQEFKMHPRGSGDIAAIKRKVDDDRIIALAQGLSRVMDYRSGRTAVADVLTAPSRDMPHFTAERARIEAATITGSVVLSLSESLGSTPVRAVLEDVEDINEVPFFQHKALNDGRGEPDDLGFFKDERNSATDETAEPPVDQNITA